VFTTRARLLGRLGFSAEHGAPARRVGRAAGWRDAVEMARRDPLDDDGVLREKKRRHAAASARWRSRERRKVQLFEFEAGAYEYNLAVKYAGLREDQTANKVLASAAMGRLLRKALLALVLQEEARRKK
jgi:hypothetical protein